MAKNLHTRTKNQCQAFKTNTVTVHNVALKMRKSSYSGDGVVKLGNVTVNKYSFIVGNYIYFGFQKKTFTSCINCLTWISLFALFPNDVEPDQTQ